MAENMSVDIAIVVGNRPQFVKLKPIFEEFIKYTTPYLIHTGQHHDFNMSETFFRDFDLPSPHINLGISGGTHGEQTGNLIISLERVFKKISPKFLVLFGDTNSTLAAALAAVKLHIKIAHIESGARIFDNFQSPEEANRVMTERVSNLLFPPTENCLNNLVNDGRLEDSFLYGDVMYDIYLSLKGKIQSQNLPKKLNLTKGNYLVVTLHRPINVDNVTIFGRIIDFLGSLDKKVVFPIHPRSKKVIEGGNLIK